jgi:hypothetical protein
LYDRAPLSFANKINADFPSISDGVSVWRLLISELIHDALIHDAAAARPKDNHRLLIAAALPVAFAGDANATTGVLEQTISRTIGPSGNHWLPQALTLITARSRGILSVMRTSVALPPLQGKGAPMRRRSPPHTFDQRLNEQKARVEAELAITEPGPQRDLLALKLRQIETAREIEDWLSSKGPQPSSRRAEPV